MCVWAPFKRSHTFAYGVYHTMTIWNDKDDVKVKLLAWESESTMVHAKPLVLRWEQDKKWRESSESELHADGNIWTYKPPTLNCYVWYK